MVTDLKILRIMRIILSKCVFDLFYVYVLNIFYPYNVYSVNFIPYKLGVSWIFCVILYLIVPINSNSVKSVFYHTQYIITVLPISTVYAFSPISNDTYLVLCFATILLEAVLLNLPLKQALGVKVNAPSFSKKTIKYGLLIGICIVILFLIRYIGIHGLELFSPENVYVVRDENMGSLPSWLDYLAKYIYYLIIPILLIKRLEEKKWIQAVLLIFLDIAIYLCMAHKTIYLLLVVVLATYMGAKKNLIELEYLGISCLMVIASVLAKVSPFVGDMGDKIARLITSFVGDRFIYGPSVNKFAYYAVFKNEPNLYFSDGRIGRLFGLKYPYGNMAPGNLAYRYCFESGMSNSITGYLGDSYMQLGIFGMILSAIVVAIMIRFFDNSSKKRVPFLVVIVVVNCYTVCMNDCPLHTMVLSTGLGLFLIYCLFGKNRN